MQKKSDKPPKPTYEQAIEEVEQIIQRIESGEAGLEQTLDQYEQAVKLIGHCREVLKRVEKRLVELTADANGRLVVEGELDEDEVVKEGPQEENQGPTSGEGGA